MNRAEIGSMTAIGGFLNEQDICTKFENWGHDIEAQKWLKIMGYNPKKIQKVTAIHIPTNINLQTAEELGINESKYNETIKYKKADIQVRVIIVIQNTHYIENISLKKANINAGYNQVDKRPVDTYQAIWGFSEDVSHWLKLFTGELAPETELVPEQIEQLRDRKKRRLYLN